MLLTSMILCAPATIVASPSVTVTPIFTAGEKNAAGFPVFGYRIPGFVAAGNISNGNTRTDATLVVLAEVRHAWHVLSHTSHSSYTD